MTERWIDYEIQRGFTDWADIAAAHNADCDALRAELARVKAESLRVVGVGNPVEYGQWWVDSVCGDVIRLTTGEYCIEASGDCVSQLSGGDKFIDIDIAIVQPVRLERWEETP